MGQLRDVGKCEPVLHIMCVSCPAERYLFCGNDRRPGTKLGVH